MMRSPTFQFPDISGEDRLRELILYIAARCQGDPKFGATKLNKILWWADFMAYADRGRPITGIEYMRLAQGPAPKRLVPVREDMVSRDEIAVTKTSGLGGVVQHRIVPLRDPNISMFSAEEIATVEHVIAAFWNKTAKGVSDLSHGKAWEVAADKASIPYEAVFLSDANVNKSDLSRTRELARRFGWAVSRA